MAINYNKGQLPKAPSNSAGMGATPGTQQTAFQNINTGANINPNMPMAPQINKQAKSSFQKGLMGQVAPKPPAFPSKPSPVNRMGQFLPKPVVTPTQIDPGRGYNIFSGMDAGSISNMNQNMGLSNLTSLPKVTTKSLAEQYMPEFNTNLPQGNQFSGKIMSYQSEPDEDGTYYTEEDGVWSKWSSNWGISKYIGKPIETIGIPTDEVPEEYLKEAGYEQNEDGEWVNPEDLPEPTQEEVFSEKADTSYEQAAEATDELTFGYPDEEFEELTTGLEEAYTETSNALAQGYEESKESLDEKYAIQLQQMLSGLDRQMAMMGTFGSGAHSTSINNAVAQGLASMAAEYAQLDKDLADNLASLDKDLADKIAGLEQDDLNQMEKDILNYIETKMKLGDKFKALAEMSTTEEEDDMQDYIAKKNLSVDIINSVTDNVAAFAADHKLAGQFTVPLQTLDTMFTEKLLNASTPEEYALIEAELEGFAADMMAIINLYEKYRNTHDRDWSENMKKVRQDELNQDFGQLLYELGILDNPNDLITKPQLYAEYTFHI